MQSLDFSRPLPLSSSLPGCHLANPGMAALCASLDQCPLINLRYLRLYWNSFTAGAMKHLAMSVSLGVLDNLEVLDVSSRFLVSVSV